MPAPKLRLWRWSVRWVRPLEKLEYRASVTPDGRLLAVRRILPEKAEAKDPGEAAADDLVLLEGTIAPAGALPAYQVPPATTLAMIRA